jgi:hypothetical protein
MDSAGIGVVFVRATSGHQSWASVSTSREFEVAERNSALPASLLEPGDLGLIEYSGATIFLRTIVVVEHHQQPETVGDAISWVRAAIADLGCHAPAEEMETAAVTKMAASPHVADRRASAQAIGQVCASLGRHRRAPYTSNSRRKRQAVLNRSKP